MCDIKNRPTLAATIFLAHMEGEESGRGEGERRAILIGGRVSACTDKYKHAIAMQSNDAHTMRKELQLIDSKSITFHAEMKD